MIDEDRRLFAGVLVGEIKPNGYFKIVNLRIALHGKLPNKFQRYMLKKVFGIDIEVNEDD